MRTFLACFLAVLLAGCFRFPDDPADPALPLVLHQETTLAPGQAVLVQNTPLRITFLGARDDSRCPEGVACLWAGQVGLDFWVQHPERDESVGAVFPNDSGFELFGGYLLEVLDVQPQTEPLRAIAADAYRVRIRVIARL